MKNKLKLFAMMLLVTTVTLAQTKWKTIDDGMYLGTYVSPVKSAYGNSTISILKIDPKKYSFEIGSDPIGMSADKWAKQENYLAVINTGMYDRMRKNLGFLKHNNKYINPILNNGQAVLALNNKTTLISRVQIIDRVVQDYDLMAVHYNTLIQSIRMVDKYGQNRWSIQDDMWSVATVAIDHDGNVLFIHCRSPYTMYHFVNIVLKSDLNIQNMMYLEGGPEASLYINHKSIEHSFIGSYETDFWDDSNLHFWDIPNVIGVVKKK